MAGAVGLGECGWPARGEHRGAGLRSQAGPAGATAGVQPLPVGKDVLGAPSMGEKRDGVLIAGRSCSGEWGRIWGGG